MTFVLVCGSFFNTVTSYVASDEFLCQLFNDFIKDLQYIGQNEFLVGVITIRVIFTEKRKYTKLTLTLIPKMAIAPPLFEIYFIFWPLFGAKKS